MKINFSNFLIIKFLISAFWREKSSMAFEFFRHKLLDLFFPIDCIACGREDVWLCPDCRRKLPLGRQEFCFFCGQNQPLGKTCPACAASHCLDGVFVCADYDNKIIAELVKKLKYSFAAELGAVLGEIACAYFPSWRWKSL